MVGKGVKGQFKTDSRAVGRKRQVRTRQNVGESMAAQISKDRTGKDRTGLGKVRQCRAGQCCAEQSRAGQGRAGLIRVKALRDTCQSRKCGREVQSRAW